MVSEFEQQHAAKEDEAKKICEEAAAVKGAEEAAAGQKVEETAAASKDLEADASKTTVLHPWQELHHAIDKADKVASITERAVLSWVWR